MPMRWLAFTAALFFWTQTSLCAASVIGAGHHRLPTLDSTVPHSHAHLVTGFHDHGPPTGENAWRGGDFPGGDPPAGCPFCSSGSHHLGQGHCELMAHAVTSAPPWGDEAPTASPTSPPPAPRAWSSTAVARATRSPGSAAFRTAPIFLLTASLQI